MLLNTFFIILSYASSPIYQIDMNNVNSSYDYTYNELTLTNEIVLSNNLYWTTDVFSKNVIVYLDEILPSDEISKIDLNIGCGNYEVINYDFYMTINYQIRVFDLDYELYGTYDIELEYVEQLAESMQTTLNISQYSTEFNYTMCDLLDTYENGYNEGFTDGYDEGNDLGYRVGYDEGYDVGIEEGRNEGQGINNVISWFGSIWDGLARILGLEIAPNLTIGTIITIPIVIAVLFFGLKALIQ